MQSLARSPRSPLVILLLIGVFALALAGAFLVNTGEADATLGQFYVTKTSPAAGEQGVDRIWQITADLNRRVDPSTVTTDSFYVEEVETGDRLNAHVEFSADYKQLILALDEGLGANTEYRVVLTQDIRADGGSAFQPPYQLVPKTWIFKTKNPVSISDFRAIRYGIPASNWKVPRKVQISIGFNMPILADSWNTDNCYLKEQLTGKKVAATNTLSADRTTITITPDQPLAGDAKHMLILTKGIRSQAKAPALPTALDPTTVYFSTQKSVIEFPDVGLQDDYYGAITALADEGVISGYTNGNFGPNDLLSRQQFAKMLAIAVKLKITGAEVCPFTDVDDQLGTDPFYPSKYVAACAAEGYTQGKTATEFAPWDDISRYQVISMATRAAKTYFKVVAITPEDYGKWKDDPTHGKNAGWAQLNGLLVGLDLDTLDPWGEMTRGETAQVLFNFYRKAWK